MAGFALVNSVNTLAQAIVSGISQTVSPLVGVFYGENDVRSIKRVVKLAIQSGIAAMVLFCVLIAIGAGPICRLFGFNSAEQLRIAVPALMLCSLSLVGVVVNQIFTYYYMTTGRTKIANLITLGRGLLFIVSSAVILVRVLGIYGIWISFTVGELLTLGMILLNARLTLRREKELKGVLLLNQRDVDEGRDISFSVGANARDALKHSDQISDFCENCSLSPKQSMMVSLAIEEILLLMINHVFADKPDESIDVKIFVREDRITMRFRCGGRKFNPLVYYQSAMENPHSLEDHDLPESMGLQLISKVAKKVDYTTNLGLNNIIIRL